MLGALQLPYLVWLKGEMLCQFEREVIDQGYVDAKTHHPVPQNVVPRPHLPSFEQQAPQTGEQAHSLTPPQVPSSVTTPVCHGGRVAVVALWATTTAVQAANTVSTFMVKERQRRSLRGGKRTKDFRAKA